MNKELKGHMGSLIINDTSITIKQGLLKENCTINEVLSIKFNEPTSIIGGSIHIKTKKNFYEIIFSKKQYDAFFEAYSYILHEKNVPKTIGNTPVEQLDSLTINNPGISLEDDEHCIYKGNAESYHSRNGVVGYTGGSSGVSLRVAKGMSVRVGSTKSTPVRGTITDKYPAILYITNKRIILVSEKYGFTINMEKLENFKIYTDALTFYVGTKEYTCMTYDAIYISNIFKLMYSAAEEQKQKKESNKNIKSQLKKSNDPYDELKKLKELLDMQIITQDEFDTKKKELLGL